MIKVLIVDDEYIMRQGLKYMINWEQEGYEIVGEATNGNEALSLVEKLQPHIIICDIVMPLLDGVDFAEAVHRMYPQIQTIILSGYDNFEYVKRTLMSGVVDYILKPTLNQEELRKILHKAAQRIPGYKLQENTRSIGYERMVERYLLGHDKELDISAFSDYFTYSHYRMYAVNIKKENGAGIDLSDVLYQKILRELEKMNSVQKIAVMLREELVCVIFCYEGSGNRRLLAAIEELNMQLVLLCGSILGVCSRSFGDLTQLKNIYQQEIMKYVDKAFYWKGQNLLFVEELEKENTPANVNKFDFYRYNQLLLSRQFGEAARLLTQYNQAALAAQMEVYGLKNQMKNMLYHFLDFLPCTDEEKDGYRFDFFREINHAVYEDDYRTYMDQIIEKLLLIAESGKNQGNDRIEQMLAYIEKNYQQDLKLENLAEEFSFNYHYLSAYFNQQMKEGFSDYLNRLRIEKACQLLEKNEGSISEISAKVGYSEHSYFCRVFKKITGKTPSAYRKNREYE